MQASEKHLASVPEALRVVAKSQLNGLVSDADFRGKRRYVNWYLREVHGWGAEQVERTRAETQVGLFNFLAAGLNKPWISQRWNSLKVDSKIFEMHGESTISTFLRYFPWRNRLHPTRADKTI